MADTPTTTPRRSRAPERSERNGEQTRARILHCAGIEFAQHGYAGARINGIVKAAGVNISLLYQYFGDKDALYLRVMEDAYRVMRRHHHEMELKDKPPDVAIETLVRSTFRIFVESPILIGLLSAENVNEARFIRQSRDIRGMYDRLIETIAEVVGRGARLGIFRDDVDAVDLFITINALGYFYFSNRHTLSFILHQDLMHPRRIDKREEHAVAVVLGYLRKGAISE